MIEDSIAHVSAFRRCTGLLLVVIAGIVGCGGSKHPTVEVSGVVTIGDALPSGAGMIVFTPTQTPAGGLMKPGRAAFDQSGQYQAQTFGNADGLLPGTYRLAVSCWESPPSMAGPPAKSYIDEKYTTARTSGLELVVDADGGPIELDLDLDPAN